MIKKNNKIKIKIDDKIYIAADGETILDVAKRNNIFLPTLCHHPDLKIKANCRVCVVEVKGLKRLVTSCSTPACSGMEIFTNSEKVKLSRDTNLKLIFSAHIEKCSSCTSKFDCSLLDLAKRYKINIADFKDRKDKRKTYKFANSVEIDGSQCIDCRNCIDVCSNVQKIGYLKKTGKGYKQEVVPVDDKNIDCIYCGQCALHCPVASAQEQYNWDDVEKILANKKGKTLVAMFAPSTRVSIGEMFGLPYGYNSSGLMVAALKKLGFDQVVDVNFGADVTTMVEAGELLERLANKKSRLPMITSCCPAWVKYVEFKRPDLIPHLTSSRSPQIHLGGIIKTYWAEKKKIKAKDIVTISIMPCTAKKFESKREELKIGGNYPIDHVLTVRELAFLIKKNNIDFKNLKKTKSNDIINDGSGAGVIYGASGGVMESALRTANHLVCKDSKKAKICHTRLEFKDVRGLNGIKEAKIDLDGNKLNVAIVNGIGNIDGILDKLGKYHYIEVMACPGGCIGGGGQIIPSSMEIVKKRMEGLYKSDKKEKIRTAHDNKGAIDVLNWVKSNDLTKNVLHTKYRKRERDKT
ncbi:ferredoxin [Candidatus Falkowbacteria bacterium HGW-Falkowbacteria-1]|uniref:Ferredoxin n=1 Tax=Candidatus Falkowbacteria bacterium HGW-Falkowbacteria-1 TaxID=2013768 RepID=A0A2N2E9L3_9BACT|nr:MAG: ferredoxin [Candidatus Falkowbacteria bacterium HGW-Falkowbacteria-1]